MKLSLRRWSLPILCLVNAAFLLAFRNWDAALGWSVAAGGWAAYEHIKSHTE
jgi:hypothetical protein